MTHRLNWKETTGLTTLFHFKWQDISTGIDFNNLSKIPSLKQTVNHLEFHTAISNKLNLFTNLIRFCEKKGLEVFSYIPFTIIMQYDSPSFASQFENFTEFYNKIKDHIIDKNSLDNNKAATDSIRKYASMFKLGIHNDKLGYKISSFIHYTYYDDRNMWLVKAPDLNRGRCIKVLDNVDKIKFTIKKFYEGIFRDFKNSEKDEEEQAANLLSKENKEKEEKKKKYDFRRYRGSCVLLQKYLEKPLLYNNRKFDVRIWVLYTHKDEVYFFKEGHLKTSSVPYDINQIDSYVHLTNYSVQKYNKEFSKYEYGNEVSFEDFQISLDQYYGKDKISVIRDILPKIIKLIRITFHSVRDKLNVNQRRNSFEIFGFDFIIDKMLDVFIIEVNTNPGLEESSPLIKKLIPRMIDDALRLTIDVAYETKYIKVMDENNQVKGTYTSPYPVEGYTEWENMWELVTDFSDYNSY